MYGCVGQCISVTACMRGKERKRGFVVEEDLVFHRQLTNPSGDVQQNFVQGNVSLPENIISQLAPVKPISFYFMFKEPIGHYKFGFFKISLVCC